MVEEPDAARLGGAAARGGALMAGRLTRFLKVEQRHKAGEVPPHDVATKARFAGDPSGLVTEPDFGDQPFLRCPRCEADNSRYVERCYNCQAPLTGEDVRAWNAQLWAKRKAEQAAAAPPHQPSPDELRARGDAIAQQILETERAKTWWLPRPVDSTPIAIQLLRLLPTTRARVIAGAIAAGTFLTAVKVAYSAHQHPQLRIGGFVVAVLIVLLFSPNLPRRRWRWWDPY
jgi:hypothetical protein